PARPRPEAADQEVHRDQDHLEEHVEQEHVGCQKQEQRTALDCEDECEKHPSVILGSNCCRTPVDRLGADSHPVKVTPGRNDHYWSDDDHQEYQGEAETI